MRMALSALPALLLLGATWGLTPSLAKLLMQDGMRPLGVAAIASCVSAALLLAVAALRGQAPPTSAAHLRHYLAGGFVGLSLANLCAFTGLQHAPAGLLALLVPLSPLVTVALCAAMGLERATPRRLLGTLLGLAGVTLAMAPGAALPDLSLLPWALLLAGTPVCYALSNALSVRLAVPGTPALAQAAGTLAGGAAGALALAVLTGQLGAPPSAGAGAILLGQGALVALAYLVYFRLLVRVGGVMTSQTSYVITLAGLFWGFWLFGEVPGWLTLPAVALVFWGVALVTLPGRGEVR